MTQSMDAWKPGLYLADELTGAIELGGEAHPVAPRDPAAIFTDTDADCFICGTKLYRSTTPNAGNYTKEDVFPQWLTKHFEIPDAFLDHPDGTSKNYKQVLVPCCVPCNNRWMNAVEQRIMTAVQSADQYAAFRQLSRSDIALWTIKIMYGLLFARIEPWSFNSHKPKPAEITDGVLDHFRFSLMLLDGYHKRVIIAGAPFPSSILILPIKPGATGPEAFDYQDCIAFPTAIAMRMGTVGLIVAFEDFGTVVNHYEKHFAPIVGNNALHPIQFMEIAARSFDLASQAIHDVEYSALDGPRDVCLRLNPHYHPGLEPDDARLYHRIKRMTRDSAVDSWKPGQTSLLKKTGEFFDLPWPAPRRMPSGRPRVLL